MGIVSFVLIIIEVIHQSKGALKGVKTLWSTESEMYTHITEHDEYLGGNGKLLNGSGR